MEALLLTLNVEMPVVIEVAGEEGGSELEHGLGHGHSPSHTGALHPDVDEGFAGVFDRTGSNGQACSKVFMIALRERFL